MSKMKEEILTLTEEALELYDKTNFESLTEVHELLGFLRGTLWSIQEIVE